MKFLMSFVFVFISGCSSFKNVERNDLILGGASMAVLLASVDSSKTMSDDEKHIAVSFIVSSFLKNSGRSYKHSVYGCLLVGATRETFKHYFKEVDFSVKDMKFNAFGCLLGANFVLSRNGSDTIFGYKIEGTF